MKIKIRHIASALSFILLFSLSGRMGAGNPGNHKASSYRMSRGVTIEDFDSGTITLTSYPGEDMDPADWTLDPVFTFNNSAYSLKLYGNTWKVEAIPPRTLDSASVWEVAAYIQDLGEIQGFGIRDSQHTLLYSFAGTEQLNTNDWITVYQGAFPQQTWNVYQLPVAHDWLSRFGYLPTITELVYINDRDQDPNAVVYFDEITDISADLPIAPLVRITYTIGTVYRNSRGQKNVDVQFHSQVYDPDSGVHAYYWDFGDSATSNLPNPSHTYLVEDDHNYTVRLEVVDSTGMWGWATCQIQVDPGPTSFPVTMNFVGDIMLARKYEQPGGIIPTQGVEAIFQPTLPFLGNAADITVANLECPLTNMGTPHPTKLIVFRGSPANVAGLVYAGIDVVTLANNHIIDYGLPGLQQTQSVLAANHIRYSGAGANSYEAYLPLFYSKSGVNIAFLAFSNRTGQYNNYQPFLNAGFNKPGFANLTPFDLTEQIQRVKPNADLIIVEMHSGSEYSVAPSDETLLTGDEPEDEFYFANLRTPSENDIQIRHLAIDQGADLVICHHPHIIQGFEVYNGKLIAHSLGDFVFDLDYPETFPTAILNARINASGFYSFSLTPVYIDDYIPVRARGELGLYILDYLARRSRELNTYLITDRENVTAEIVLDSLLLTPTDSLCSVTVNLHEENGYRVSDPMRLSHKGSISSLSSVAPSGNWEYRLGREIIWFGNFEDEGCSLWYLNHPDEYYDSTVFYRGSRSLCQKRPPGLLPLNTNLEQRIKLYSNTSDLTLHSYIKTENAQNAGILIRFYNSRTMPYHIGSNDLGTEVNGTTEWAFYYNTFVPPTGAGYLDIRLRSESPNAGVGYSWFDDVGLIEWEDWKSVTQDEIPTPNDYYWIQIRTGAPVNSAALEYQQRKYRQTSTPVFPRKNRVAEKFTLSRNYPNPFNPSTKITYRLPGRYRITLKIYNILGQEIRTLVDRVEAGGERTIRWDGKNNNGREVSSGIYLYSLTVRDPSPGGKIRWIQARKMVRIK